MIFNEIDSFDINSSGLITYNVDWEVLESPPIKITQIKIGKCDDCIVSIFFSTIYEVSDYKIVDKIFIDKFKVSLNVSGENSYIMRWKDNNTVLNTVLVCCLSLTLYEAFNPYYLWGINEAH